MERNSCFREREGFDGLFVSFGDEQRVEIFAGPEHGRGSVEVVEREMSEEDFSSVVREEVLRKLRELIDLLPGERRKVILMSMDGMSGEEIAAKLGVTIHTVKQQKYLAYKFIKQELGKYWIVAMLFFL